MTNKITQDMLKNMSQNEIKAFKLGYSCGQFDAPENLIDEYVI